MSSYNTKDFITKMLALNPEDRMDLDSIKQHPWMNEQTATMLEACAEIVTKRFLIEEEILKG